MDYRSSDYHGIVPDSFAAGLPVLKGKSGISVQIDHVEESVLVIKDVISMIKSKGFELVTLEECVPYTKKKCIY